MQQHVMRRQNVYPGKGRALERRGQHTLWVRACSRRLGQYAVVNIENGAALYMDHRRQFMHPLAIVALVISIVDGVDPALPHQERLEFTQLALVDQDVDITKRPTLGKTEIRREIRGPLEQGESQPALGAYRGKLLDFERRIDLLSPVEQQSTGKVSLNRLRETVDYTRSFSYAR